MIFKSQSNMMFNYALIIGMILLLIVVIILYSRGRTGKKFVIPVCLLFIVLIAVWGFHIYNYGIKKVVFPTINGENAYTSKTEIKGYLKWLSSMKLEEVEYDIKHDPGMLSGRNECSDIVYNNGDTEEYIYGADYLLVLKGGKEKEKHLYQVME